MREPLATAGPKRQFGVRSLLVAMTLAGLLLAFWLPLATLSFPLFWPMLVLLMCASFAIGRRFGCGRPQRRRLTLSSLASYMLLVAGVAVTLLSLTVRYRWINIYVEPYTPWPSVDEPLFALHAWFDARYPAAPGGIKVEGEYHRVLLTVNLAALATAAIASLLIGIVSRLIAPLDWAAVQFGTSLHRASAWLVRHSNFGLKVE